MKSAGRLRGRNDGMGVAVAASAEGVNTQRRQSALDDVAYVNERYSLSGLSSSRKRSDSMPFGCVLALGRRALLDARVLSAEHQWPLGP